MELGEQENLEGSGLEWEAGHTLPETLQLLISHGLQENAAGAPWQAFS
jgi:hypothetical protein